MKKFEFTFTNEWKSAIYGFDFIKFGFFGDTDWTDSYDYLSFDLTILGFNFNLTWNSDNGIDDKIDLALIDKILADRQATILFDVDDCELGAPKKAAKKAVKKVAKKATKKSKKVAKK